MSTKRFCIKKGRHFSFPRRPKLWWSRSIEMQVAFNLSDAQYELPKIDGKHDIDWKDWMKVTGISVGLAPNKNAVMLVHRFNPISVHHEVAIYINKHDKSFMVSEPVVLNTGDGVSGTAYLKRDGKYLLGRIGRLELKWMMPTDTRLAYRIQPYFGGNERAPNKVCYDLLFL